MRSLRIPQIEALAYKHRFLLLCRLCFPLRDLVHQCQCVFCRKNKIEALYRTQTLAYWAVDPRCSSTPTISGFCVRNAGRNRCDMQERCLWLRCCLDILFLWSTFSGWSSASRPIGPRDEEFLIKNDSAGLLTRCLTALSVSLTWFLLNPQAGLVSVGIFNSESSLPHSHTPCWCDTMIWNHSLRSSSAHILCLSYVLCSSQENLILIGQSWHFLFVSLMFNHIINRAIVSVDYIFCLGQITLNQFSVWFLFDLFK